MTEKSLTLFVNYRRADDKVFVELLRTHFMFRYGQDNVFMDFDTIPPFADFAEFIKDRVRASDVLVMMIGKNWLKLLKDKEANGEPDYVRMELEEALKHNIPIAPILIQGAQLPDKADVPESLQPIWSLNIPAISEGRDLLNNIGYIMGGFERAVAEKGKRRIVENQISSQKLMDMPKIDDTADLDTALKRLGEALHPDKPNYPEALVWISYIRTANVAIPKGFRLDDRERDIQQKLRDQEEAKRRREVCDYHYKFVRPMLIFASHDEIRAMVEDIWQVEDGYIPDDLKAQLKPIMRQKIVIPPKPKILLPAPFDWCYIPEGEVTLTTDAMSKDIYIQKDTVVTVPAFWMAKYPVTNAQFEQFIRAGGYQTDKWWTKGGIAQRNIGNWTQPCYWDDKQFNSAECPVVGVSWYEAIAFCNWLSEKTGDKIILPNDAQWQRAAQGDDGREYPWGNGWIVDACNSNKKVGRTTHVQKYEGKGNSPFDVVDMSGNVWEWCMTVYRTGSNDVNITGNRLVRGGSWGAPSAVVFRTSFRTDFPPDDRGIIGGGIRLVCSS